MAIGKRKNTEIKHIRDFSGNDNEKFYIHSFLRTGMPLGESAILYVPKIKIRKPTPRELLDRLKAGIKNSVDSIAGDDKKIGITLSGGIDSSTTTLLLSEIYPDRELFTYNLAPKKDYGVDESQDAKTIAEKCGTVHKLVYQDEESYIKSLQELVKISPAPSFGSPFYFAALKAMKQDNVDIVVLGEGGDEVLGGYYPGTSAYKRYMKYQKLLTTSFKIELFFAIATGLTKWRLKELYNSKMKKMLKRNVFSPFKKFFNLTNDPVLPLDLIRLADLYNRRYQEWIAYCNHLGLKPVFPFLHSNDFIDFCYSIPKELRRDDKFGKLILRKALEGNFPETIVWKKKIGFAMGDRLYHTKILFSFMKSVFDKSLLIEDGLIRKDFVDRYLEINRKDWRYYTLLTLFVLELWYREKDRQE